MIKQLFTQTQLGPPVSKGFTIQSNKRGKNHTYTDAEINAGFLFRPYYCCQVIVFIMCFWVFTIAGGIFGGWIIPGAENVSNPNMLASGLNTAQKQYCSFRLRLGPL